LFAAASALTSFELRNVLAYCHRITFADHDFRERASFGCIDGNIDLKGICQYDSQ
jgi:hypothetical protein